MQQMAFKSIFKNKSLFVFVCGVLLFSLSGLIFQWWHSSCCDADSYIAQANSYISQGIFTSTSGYEYIHTYVYPLYLSLIVKIATLFHAPQAVSIVFFQTLTYFISILLLYNAIALKDTKIAKIVFILLCANIFLMPYLGITLSDGFYTILFILWLSTCLIFFHHAAESNKKLICYCAMILAFLSALILETRPAGIWVPAVTAIVLITCWIQYAPKKQIFSYLLIASCIIVFAIPLIPQIIINMTQFDHFTALPHYSFSSTHLGAFGKKAIRFGAFLPQNSGPLPFYYQNPYFTETMNSIDSYAWYFLYPAQGAATILLKFVELFDYYYIFPFPDHILKPHYALYTRLSSFTIFYLGIVGLLTYLKSSIPKTNLPLGPKYFAWTCLIAWGGVSLLTVPELRFGLPMVILFMMFTGYMLPKKIQTTKPFILAILSYIICILSLVILSENITQNLHIIPQ